MERMVLMTIVRPVYGTLTHALNIIPVIMVLTASNIFSSVGFVDGAEAAIWRRHKKDGG